MPHSDDHDAGTMDASALQELLLGTDTLEDFLNGLAIRATHETRHRCGITVRSDHGPPFTAASSDELTRDLDELQYAEGAGPCLEALTTGVPVFVTDMALETRWGGYPRHAVEIGARSSMSYPLISGNESIGALNLYSFEPSAPGGAMQARAAQLAEHAAGALALALRIAERGEVIENLRAALTSRSTIDQAIGILMAQQRCDSRTAFDLLRKASQGRNTKLREVAAIVVAGVAGVAAGPAHAAGTEER
jgi:GAF domain-containing protein